MQRILLDAFGGTGIRYTARVGDSLLAAVHFTVATDPVRPARPELSALTKALRGTIRTWNDRLVAAVVGGDEELDTAGALSRYADAFDEAYKENYRVEDAVADLRLLDGLSGPDDLALTMAPAAVDDAGEWRLKLYVTGGAVTLSRALPVLQHLGAEVLDERPFEVRRSDGTASRIYDFGLSFPHEHTARGADDPELRTRFTEAFVACWTGACEVDGFNQLVLAAGLAWREIAVLRAYAHYLRQVGTPYTQRYLEQVLTAYPALTADLNRLFGIRFDPDLPDPDARAAAARELVSRVTAALDEVTSLDADRILRTLLTLITATARSNAYRRDDDGRLRAQLEFQAGPAPGARCTETHSSA